MSKGQNTGKVVTNVTWGYIMRELAGQQKGFAFYSKDGKSLESFEQKHDLITMKRIISSILPWRLWGEGGMKVDALRPVRNYSR